MKSGLIRKNDERRTFLFFLSNILDAFFSLKNFELYKAIIEK